MPHAKLERQIKEEGEIAYPERSQGMVFYARGKLWYMSDVGMTAVDWNDIYPGLQKANDRAVENWKNG